MNKYQNGKIYKVVNQASNDPYNFYLGSTINELRFRFSYHKTAWKRQVNGKVQTGMRLYEEFTKIGIDNFKIMLIENYPCNSKDELRKREEELRLLLKPNYNVIRAYRTYEQLQQYKTEYYKNHPNQKRDWIAANNHRYHCEACNYHTAQKGCLNKHFNSKKHKLEYDEYIFDVEMDRMADITIFD